MARSGRRIPARLVFAIALLPCDAASGPPYQTDDPALVKPRQVELLLFAQQTLDSEGRSGTAPGLEIQYGAAEGLELDLVLPLAFATPRGETTRRGYGDTEFGLKYRLVEEAPSMPLLSLVPSVRWATGRADRGLGDAGNSAFLALSAQKTEGDWTVFGTGGYRTRQGGDSRGHVFLGAAVKYRASERWIPGVEFFWTGPQADGESASTGCNVGMSFLVDRQRQFMISAGRGLGNAGTTNRGSAFIGYQVTY